MPRGRASSDVPWLATLVVLALLLRCLGAAHVFVGGGDVVLFLGDASFHTYRALASLDRFPSFLSFDQYLNFPDGAVVPSPPGYDLLVAGMALLLGGTQRMLESIAASLPALTGAATVLPVYSIGWQVGGRRVGLLAAFLIAVMPANAVYSLLGYADHHAAVAFLVACWLAMAVRIADDRVPMRTLVLSSIGLWLVRTAMMATWSGSVLYLALGDGSLAIALVATQATAAPLAALALSLVASALAIAPLVAASPAPLGGPLSAIDLSWLQPLACAALAAWTGAIALRARFAPSRPPRRRAIEALLFGTLALIALLATPSIRDNVSVGLAFVSKTDAWGAAVLEQLPLFSHAPGAVSATMLFGWLAYLVPLAPFLALPLLRAPATRGAGIVLFAWSAALGALTLSQNRYACDFSVMAAVLFACALLAASTWCARRVTNSVRAEWIIAMSASTVLLAPAFARFHLPQLRSGLNNASRVEHGIPGADRALATVHGTALRFAQEIRRVTPETSGFQRSEPHPEYGILSDPSLGYTIQYAARRPTPASNAGPYVGAENAFAVQRFRALGTEEEALELANRMRVRYVVTEARAEYGPRTLLQQLHARDGAGYRGMPRWEQLRLVTEGPAGGRPLATILGGVPPWGRIPYKLFEIVPGAVLDVPCPPGEKAVARISVRTPLRRTFTYTAEAIASDDGRARMRVPYATETTSPARPLGPWSITAGDEVYRVDLRDAEVLSGATVSVDGNQAATR
jgi:dolichyl-diphosphooligosaccharide--protein glycosyltransferase